MGVVLVFGCFVVLEYMLVFVDFIFSKGIWYVVQFWSVWCYWLVVCFQVVCFDVDIVLVDFLFGFFFVIVNIVYLQFNEFGSCYVIYYICSINFIYLNVQFMFYSFNVVGILLF